MKRSADVYLDDILESISKIDDYVGESAYEDFRADPQLQDSVIRRLEIIGEAAKSLPESLKGRHPKIPWKEIIGMRDILVHAYFGVKMERVWKVVEDDLPALRHAVMLMKKEAE